MSYHRIPSPLESDKDLLLIIAFEIIKLLDNRKYVSMKDLIENNGRFDIISKEAPMLYNLIGILRCDATPQEITAIFAKYISGESFS